MNRTEEEVIKQTLIHLNHLAYESLRKIEEMGENNKQKINEFDGYEKAKEKELEKLFTGELK